MSPLIINGRSLPSENRQQKQLQKVVVDDIEASKIDSVFKDLVVEEGGEAADVASVAAAVFEVVGVSTLTIIFLIATISNKAAVPRVSDPAPGNSR